MATIITDSLNIKITSKMALENINPLFVELGFDVIDIKKRKAFAESEDDLIIDLLTSWKNKHGCGRDQALTLKKVMTQFGVNEAARLIHEAIEKVGASPPVRPEGLLTDEDATSTSASTQEQSSPMES